MAKPKHERIDDTQKGELRWIDKWKLVIPRTTYQREATSLMPKIARKFRWLDFGCLSVCSDGQVLAVVEGGNRLDAALLRDDIVKVPCIVHSVKDVEQQAAYFVTMNVNRRRLGAFDLQKAGVIAKDKLYLTAQAYVAKLGRKLERFNQRSDTFTVLAALHQCLRRYPIATTRLCGVLKEITAGKAFGAEFFKALVYLEHHLPRGESFTTTWYKRLMNTGLEACEAGIRKSVRQSKLKQAAKLNVYNAGLLEALNTYEGAHGRHNHRQRIKLKD